jgi:integrase
MKWLQNHQVEGTSPLVTIAKPSKREADGRIVAGRFYHERYTVNGQTTTRSLRTGNKKEAIRRVFERLMGVDTPQANCSVTVAQGLDEYLQVCRDRDLAPRSIQKYDLVIREVKQALAKRSEAPASEFSEKDFWAYNRFMTDGGLNRKTRYDRLIVLKQAIKYLSRSKQIPSYPLDAIRLSKPESKPQPCFTAEQVAALLGSADKHLRPIYYFFAYTGARFGEVRDVLWTDLLLDRGANGFIRISRGGSRADMPKDKESRLVPLHPDLRAILDDLPRLGERVFYDIDKKSPLAERKLLKQLKALCAKNNFKNAQSFKLHSFRHYFCSTAAKENLSYRYVLAWLGHSDSKIVDMYFRQFDDAADIAMSSMRLGPERSDRKAGNGDVGREEGRQA